MDHVVELVIRFTSPVFHGGDEKTGSETLFRRMKVWHNGRLVDVPFISGNAVRGLMRRLVFKDMVDRLGYELRSMKLYHTLFSGGVLETTDATDTRLDVDLRRRVRSLLPPLSLLGAAIGNQVLEGKLRVMHLLPVCRELSDYHADWVLESYREHAATSCYQFLDWVFQTRRAEEKRRSKEEQAVQMLYRFEVLVPGTHAYTRMVCSDCSPLELSCLAHMLALLEHHGQLGGKPATGYGSFQVVARRTTAELDPTMYTRFLEERRGEITRLLDELAKRLG